MKTHILTMLAACAAVFALVPAQVCAQEAEAAVAAPVSGSAVEIISSTIDELATSIEKPDNTAADIVAAFNAATAKLKTAKEIAKQDVEKARADMAAFEASEAAPRISAHLEAALDSDVCASALQEDEQAVSAALIEFTGAIFDLAEIIGGGE